MFKLNAYDPDIPDRHTLTYYADGLPKGAILNKQVGIFTWIPKLNQKGTYNVRFYVKDLVGGVDEETININVH